MMTSRPFLIAMVMLAISYMSGPVQAQKPVAPPPGSPAATTSIDGKQLPAPDPKFGGEIKSGALKSKAWWAPRVVPPLSRRWMHNMRAWSARPWR